MVNDWKYSIYSKVDSEVKRNFPYEKPRQHQLETISEIKEAIDNGYKYIVLEAGTGTGKSAIAATLALMHDSTYILTVTKQLQDQYLKDFRDLGFNLVKGRGNFKCKKYAEDNIDNYCDEGRCVLEGYRCEYSLNRNPDDVERSNTCPYYYQKFRALNSSVVISNYPYLFLELNYVEDFKKRQLMIFDEAHNLENNLMNQLKLEFTRKELKEYVGINLSADVVQKLEFGDYVDWIRFIKRVKENYTREYNKIKNIKGKSGLNEKKSFLKLRIDDCTRFIEHIYRDPSKWIFDFNSRYGVAEFKPIKVDNYAKNNLFRFADVCIFMSATILDYKLFAQWLGIGEKEIYAIRRESPFKVERNPIKTFDDFNMSYGNLSVNAPKTVDTIREILEYHRADKGIIHTISHQCKNFLKTSLHDDRLIDHNTSNRAKQLEKFKKTKKPLVLISPSMNEGVDLPGDQCRFQIIYKIPFPSLADKQTKMRKNIDFQWYDYKTALALVQTYGRGMRFENDYCRTYFIDSRLKNFISNDSLFNNFLPDFFKKAIDITPEVIDSTEEVESERVELRKDLLEKYANIVEEEPVETEEKSTEIISAGDGLDYESKVNLKIDLTLEANDLLKDGEYKKAIKSYKDLLNHELFINDYHPYLKLAKAYHGAEEYENEVKIIEEFFKSGRFCRPSTVKWFKKCLRKLDELGYYDISNIDDLESEFKRRGKKNRKLSKIPVPLAVDLKSGSKNKNRKPKSYDPSMFDDFVKMDDNLTYEEKIRFKYKLVKKGDELLKNSKLKSIAYYNRLLTHELFVNDYHPYLKLYKAYGKDKQKDSQVDIIIRFFKTGIYCSDKKYKWFKNKLKYLSGYGHLDPSLVDELENEYYSNGYLNKDLADTPVPIALKVKKLCENEEEDLPVNYSQNLFNDLSKGIINQPGYQGYLDLTKFKDDDYVSIEDYDKVNEKADLKNQGKELEKENPDKAVEFYDKLKDNDLFKHDYYLYRRQCILFKNYIHDDLKDWQTILEIFSNEIYLNNHQYTWLNNKIIELIGKLNLKQHDINKINVLLENYEINKDKYKILQENSLPIAERIFKDEDGLKVISQKKYDYIENIHYFNELGAGYIRRGDYETAMKFFAKMLNQKLPYFKCRAYKSFARIYRSMDDKKEFARLYEKYVEN